MVNVVRFTKDTAEKTGKSERAVQRAAERGDKIAADVLRKVSGTFLDNGVYLDGLKGLSHDEQRAKVEKDVKAGKKRKQKKAEKRRLAQATTTDEGSVEAQLAAVMAAWNKAGTEARQSFCEICTDRISPASVPSAESGNDKWSAEGHSWWSRGKQAWRTEWLKQIGASEDIPAFLKRSAG